MQSKSVYSHINTCKFFSFLAGLFYILWIVSYVFIPIDLLNPSLSLEFFAIVKQKKAIFIINNMSFIFASFCMIGIVSTFNFLGRDENAGILNFISVIGTIGFSFGILSKTSYLFYIMKLIPIYESLSFFKQDMIKTIGIQQFDYGVMSFGATGIWFFVVSFLALTNSSIPKKLSIMSLFIGIFSVLLVVFGFIFPPEVSYPKHELFIHFDIGNLCFLGYISLLNIWVFLEGFYLHSISKK